MLFVFIVLIERRQKRQTLGLNMFLLKLIMSMLIILATVAAVWTLKQ